MSAKLNLKIIQGSTYKKVLRWESSTKEYVTINSITKSAPIVINTENAHSIPINWRVKITNVVGMKEINNDEEYKVVTDTTSTSITINKVNSVGYSAYTSGGIIEYNKPVPLASFDARMQIRAKLNSDTVILELSSEDDSILIDDTDYTITILLTAEQTALLNFNSAVYSLEIISPTGEVIQLVSGNITLIKEITREQ